MVALFLFIIIFIIKMFMSKRKYKNLDIYSVMKQLFEHVEKHPEDIPLIEKMANVKIHV